MGTRAVVAVQLQDGTFLASNVAQDGDTLGERLHEGFGSLERALGLVVLGDMLDVAADGRLAICPVNRDPVIYADLNALDAGKITNAKHIHVFRNGAWEHLLDDEGQYLEALDALEAAVEMAD